MNVNSNMTWRGLVCGAILLGGHGLCPAVAAGAPSALAGGAGVANPYAVINDRNPFRLNAPPPPVEALPAPAAQLPEVIFSGTMINAGVRTAMFAVQYKEARDPGAKGVAAAQPTTSYICLKENETEGSVQLLRIMKDGAEVEIMNAGTRMVLNMKENGFAKEQAGAARGGGPPGLRQLPGGNPNLNMPAGLPGQPAAQNAAYDGGGIYVGGNTGNTGRGVNVAGMNVGNMGGGTITGGAPQTMNQPGIFQQASPGGYNNGSILSGGAPRTANPVTTTLPGGLNPTAMNTPGNLGSQSSLQPNNSGATLTPLRNVQPPPQLPALPAPGQKD